MKNFQSTTSPPGVTNLSPNLPPPPPIYTRQKQNDCSLVQSSVVEANCLFWVRELRLGGRRWARVLRFKGLKFGSDIGCVTDAGYSDMEKLDSDMEKLCSRVGLQGSGLEGSIIIILSDM